MPGCVLRVIGETFDVDAFLQGSDLNPCHVHRRGDTRRGNDQFLNNGLTFDVSEAGSVLAAQVVDAVRFLSTHEQELRRLQAFPGVEDLRLDFGYYRRDVAAHLSYLPPELLARAGELGVGIELSLYLALPSGTDGESTK